LDLRPHLSNDGKPHAWSIRFGGRWEDWADGDIVSPFAVRGKSLLETMCGFPDQSAGAEQLAGKGHRQIVLPQMDSIRSHGGSHINPVVDDEGHARGPRDTEEALRIVEQLPGRGGLFTELKDVGAALDGLLGELRQVTIGRGGAVDDGVESPGR